MSHTIRFWRVCIGVLMLVFFNALLVPASRASCVVPPGVDPFTPHASAEEYAVPPYGLNKNGILYFDYGDRYDNLGKFENPTFIAAYANALYRDYLRSKDNRLRNKFIRQVDYLISVGANGFYWPYPFENPHYAAPVGWYSGMTSGRTLGVIVRAYQLTQDRKYLDFAKGVFEKLKTPIERGGMSTVAASGVWIEEVAYIGSKSFKILNGHIFGLSGLIAYARCVGDPAANDMVASAIDAVKNSLDDFDAGFLSYYSESAPEGKLRPFAERGGYNVIHVSQMLWLYSITAFEKFLEKAMKFQFYETFSPKISASFSTNDKTHGPERMNLTFGRNYWSSYVFPVDVENRFNDTRVLKEVVILGHIPESTPRSYQVEIFNGQEWKVVAKRVDNTIQRDKIRFAYDVVASSIKFRFESDNGNGAVALDGIGLTVKNGFSPVVDFSNFTSGTRRLFDSDRSTGALIKGTGFVVFPASAPRSQVLIEGTLIEPDNVTILGSNDLKTWDSFPHVVDAVKGKAAYEFASRSYSFYMIKFGEKFASKINEIAMK